jgi:hypothetical protein
MFFPEDKVLSSNPNTPGFCHPRSQLHKRLEGLRWYKPEGGSIRADVGVLANMIEAEQNPSVIHPENDAQS